MKCTKAIVPVAGYGTRRLPITKAIEKCMLPIGNRPIVDYVVEDCLRAGITDIIFVVGEQSDQIRTFYGKNELLDNYLEQKGKSEQAQALRHLARQARFEFVTQDSLQPYGTAVPLFLCREFIDPDEQVMVLTGDDFIFNEDGSSEVARLMRRVDEDGLTAGLLAARIPQAEVFRYGVIETQTYEDAEVFKRIVEQPAVEDAPSNLINISKYVFDHELIRLVEEVMQKPPAANGEYQIIEALNLYVGQGRRLSVVPVVGDYLDGGNLEGWLHANQRVFEASKA